MDETGLKCPRCDCEALYRYGKTRHGKQRFLCLMCGRQFGGDSREEIKTRPFCPACGKKMHIYRKTLTEVRFRCSDYPACRTYQKLGLEKSLFCLDTANSVLNTY
ncbi:MAG: IS1/IS1595 family N-terminal zinc-binding domain-containing protein [Syntrophobacteraceae bacterium]